MDNVKTIKVKRANVVLDVPEYQKVEYLAQGYDILGDDGKPVERAIPTDYNALKKLYLEQSAKLAETDGVPQEDYDKLLEDYNAVQDENEALKARIEELEASKKKSTKK